MRAVTLADTLPAVRWRPVWRGVAPKRLSSEFPVDHASRTGWGRTVRPPCDGGHGPAATGRRRRNRCRSRAAWTSGRGWRRRSWGGWSSQASNAAARQRVRRPSPRPRDRPRSRRCSRPARAAMTCRPRPWDGQRVAPVVPPAGTVDRGDGAERRVGGHWSRLRGQSVRMPRPAAPARVELPPGEQPAAPGQSTS